MLRVRSLLTGRPVAELAFAEGQRLKIDEIFPIPGSGVHLGHWPVGTGASEHDRRVSGVLTAINEVATEAFEAEQSALRRIDLGNSVVLLRASPTYLLAAKCRAWHPPPSSTSSTSISSTQSSVCARFSTALPRSPSARSTRCSPTSRPSSTSDGRAACGLPCRSGLSPAAVLVGAPASCWRAGAPGALIRATRRGKRAISPSAYRGPKRAQRLPRARGGGAARRRGLAARAGADGGCGPRGRAPPKTALPLSQITDRTAALPTRRHRGAAGAGWAASSSESCAERCRRARGGGAARLRNVERKRCAPQRAQDARRSDRESEWRDAIGHRSRRHDRGRQGAACRRGGLACRARAGSRAVGSARAGPEHTRSSSPRIRRIAMPPPRSTSLPSS